MEGRRGKKGGREGRIAIGEKMDQERHGRRQKIKKTERVHTKKGEAEER